MRVKLTDDPLYPIKFDDTWSEGAYLHFETVEDPEKFLKFLCDIIDKREQYLKKNKKKE